MVTTAPSLAERLREIVPPDRVIDDPATLLPYAYDASFWSLRQQRLRTSSSCRARPRRSRASCASPMRPAPRSCRAARAPGQTGGAIAAREGSSSPSRGCGRYRDRSAQPAGRRGAGHRLRDLQDALRPRGLFFCRSWGADAPARSGAWRRTTRAVRTRSAGGRHRPTFSEPRWCSRMGRSSPREAFARRR